MQYSTISTEAELKHNSSKMNNDMPVCKFF